MDKYLEIIIDCLKPKPTISAHLLHVADGETYLAKALNLLTLPPRIFRMQRLMSKTARSLTKQDDEALEIRKLYSRMVERTLILADQMQQYRTCKHANHSSMAHSNVKIAPIACNQILDALLGLLSLRETLSSLDALLKQGTSDVSIPALFNFGVLITTRSAVKSWYLSKIGSQMRSLGIAQLRKLV